MCCVFLYIHLCKHLQTLILDEINSLKALIILHPCSLLASYLDIDSSPLQSDLAAVAISDGSEEYNEHEWFLRDGGNRTEMFGGRQSNEDLQHFPWKVNSVRATNLFPALDGTPEPTHSRPMFLDSLPLSQSIHRSIMTNYRCKPEAPPQSRSLFRWRSLKSPSTHSTGTNPLQVDFRFLTFRGADVSLQDMVICDHEVI